MPPSASTSNIEDKVDDLERSVTYLADQNISLQKCLDTSNQLVSKLEQRLVILGEMDTFIICSLFRCEASLMLGVSVRPSVTVLKSFNI